MRRVKLNSLSDREIWICDDRTAALISGNGITQIDYHGLQPVSRNARIFLHDEFVIKAFLKIAEKKKKEIKWNSIDWYPNKIESFFEIDGYSGTANISLLENSLLFWLSFDDIIQKDDRILLELVFNKKCLTKDVQGNRTHEIAVKQSDSIIYKINDKIQLNSWMKQKGAYQGDFMIPESWRRMIFKKYKISGLAVYGDLKKEYKNDNLLLYDENIFVVIGGSGYHIKETADDIVFKFEYNPDTIDESDYYPFCISFGNGLVSAKNEYHKALDKGIQCSEVKKINYEIEYNHSPKIRLDPESSIEQFFQLFPSIVQSARIKQLGVFRACASSYYWLWAWDSMVTANALSYCGMNNDRKKVIEFIGSNRNYDGAIPMQWSRRLEPMDAKKFGTLDFLFANLVIRQFAGSNDFSLVRENYPLMVYSFGKICESCDIYGMIRSIGMYPDLPAKLGRTENSYVSMESGSVHSVSIIMNQLSTLMNDPVTNQKSEKLIRLIQKYFLSRFYDKEKGFLIDSYNESASRKRKKNNTYPLYSLLFLLNPASISLLRPVLGEIENFIEQNLFDDNGLKLTPVWDRNRRSEDAMSSWYPYWDLFALKIFRRRNNTTAIKKWIKIVSECFSYYGYCPEFVLSGEDLNSEKGKWKRHGTPWNLNCSAGWYQGIIESVFGFEEDIGGISYIPMSPVSEKMTLKNIFLRGIESDVEITGNGAHVSSFMVNGSLLQGCLKIPETFYSGGKLEIKIHHSNDGQALYFKELNGAVVKQVIYSKDKVNLTIESFGFLDVLFYSTEKAELLIDNQKIKYSWQKDSNEGHISLFLFGCHDISINVSA